MALHPAFSRSIIMRNSCPKGSAFQDFPTPPSNGSARRSAVGLLGSNTLFTGLKGYPAVLYTYQLGR